MLLPPCILALISAASALVLPEVDTQHIFTNPPQTHNAAHRIPSIRESTVMARRILHLSSLGTLVTSFPDPSDTDLETLENRPAGMANNPIGLMEYYADCEGTGNPTVLAIDIATPYKNYQQGSNISLAVRWWPKQTMSYAQLQREDDDDDDDEDIPTPHTPAALPRFSLHGYLEPITSSSSDVASITSCFLATHPDSILWQPGNDISHESEYMRFVVEHVYWFGGFGDRARIGWLPIQEWRDITMEEVRKMRLPGEKGWQDVVWQDEL